MAMFLTTIRIELHLHEIQAKKKEEEEEQMRHDVSIQNLSLRLLIKEKPLIESLTQSIESKRTRPQCPAVSITLKCIF